MAPQKTNWVAIIGAPGAGKTSVIEEIARRGYETKEEIARAYMQERLAAGDTLEHIRGPENLQNLQLEIFRRTLARDASLDPDALIFFDRGLPDSITYFRQAGLDPAPALEAARGVLYRAVFLLDRLPIVADEVRTESNVAAQQMEAAFLSDYTALGYDVVRVPVMSVSARADFILEQLHV